MVFLLVGCGAWLPLGYCQQTQFATVAGKPSVEITTVPLAGADNAEKLSAIEGRVVGALPGQKIVLYAKGKNSWWVQPLADNPFTSIRPDSTWSNTTHPGTEYAALLVGPEFHPPLTADVLPTDGVFASAVVQGEIGFWQTWWFALACLLLVSLSVLGFHRLRMRQVSNRLNMRFEERLAERMRIAQELHDTLLQGVLSVSMQLHVAVDSLPEDSPARPRLNRTVELMSHVVEEGRNTLRGLRTTVESENDLKSSFSQIPQELGNPAGVDFRVIVQGESLPMRAAIHDEVYRIGREALVNAFRHARAKNIDVLLEYNTDHLRLLVTDDGCGIESQVLQSGRDGHWGLSGMRARAEKIGAKFRVLSRPEAGTEVELCVPGSIAFVPQPSDGLSKWISKLIPTWKSASSESPREHRQ
jgi:hypothetical protein